MNLINKDISNISIAYGVSITAYYFKMCALQYFKDKNIDITPEQFALLSIIASHNGLYQRQLAQIAFKDRPNITRLIDILEKRTFVYREIDSSDRRIIKVFITDEGRKTVADIMPLINEIRAKTVEGITEEEVKVLQSVLQKICNNLESTFTLKY